MSNPLEYWNPNRRPDQIDPAYPKAPDQPLAAVPIEFDFLLTQTTELAAANAIVCALKKNQIAVHESDDGSIANREIMLYVRSADQARAVTIAAEIFARRKKIRSLPRQKTRPDTPSIGGLDISSFMP